VVGLLSAAQWLHGVGWVSVAEHVLALSDFCQSALVAPSPMSDWPVVLHCIRPTCVFVKSL